MESTQTNLLSKLESKFVRERLKLLGLGFVESPTLFNYKIYLIENESLKDVILLSIVESEIVSGKYIIYWNAIAVSINTSFAFVVEQYKILFILLWLYITISNRFCHAHLFTNCFIFYFLFSPYAERKSRIYCVSWVWKLIKKTYIPIVE